MITDKSIPLSGTNKAHCGIFLSPNQPSPTWFYAVNIEPDSTNRTLASALNFDCLQGPDAGPLQTMAPRADPPYCEESAFGVPAAVVIRTGVRAFWSVDVAINGVKATKAEMAKLLAMATRIAAAIATPPCGPSDSCRVG